jgi:hypothetical protein
MLAIPGCRATVPKRLPRGSSRRRQTGRPTNVSLHWRSEARRRWVRRVPSCRVGRNLLQSQTKTGSQHCLRQYSYPTERSFCVSTFQDPPGREQTEKIGLVSAGSAVGVADRTG